jgi:hypothetical protein
MNYDRVDTGTDARDTTAADGGTGGTGGVRDGGGNDQPEADRRDVGGGDSDSDSDTDGGLADSGAEGGGAITCYGDRFGTHDYAFCDALVAWPTARTECETRGMRLVRIDDAAENDWVVTTAAFSASMFRRESLWIGGYEPTVDGDWHWTDGEAFWSGDGNGSPVGGLYTNWDRTEPNNAVSAEACAGIRLNDSAWLDLGCSFGAYFACEAY